MHTRGQVDFLWQFFHDDQIAIFALLFIYDKTVESLNPSPVLAVCAIALFDWINAEHCRAPTRSWMRCTSSYRADFGHPERFQSVRLRSFRPRETSTAA